MRRVAPFAALALLLALLWLPAPAAANPGWPDALRAVGADPKPKRITNSTHYVVSNEHRHDRFKPHVDDRGGLFVGVGTDQCYTFIGWQRPEAAVLMDFDQWVVDVHKVYEIIFAAAEDRVTFVKLWSPRRRKETKRLIKAAVADPELAAMLVKRHEYARWKVWSRLKWQRDEFEKRKVASYLTDDEQYRFVRKMYADQRIVAVRGDLTGDITLRHVGDLARKMKVPVRVLYLSNAEHYFKYGKGFRTNIKQLHYDDRSVVLRTRNVSGGKVYEYYLQTIANLAQWMSDGRTQYVNRLFKYRTKTDVFRLYLNDQLPPIRKKTKHATDRP